MAAKGDLLQLQSRMKQDPEGYITELELQLRHFRACLDVLALEGPVAAKSGSDGRIVLASGTDHGALKELGDLAMFLAHITPSYPKQMAGFPHELLELLKNVGLALPGSLRRQLTQALILLRNREKIGIVDALPVMMKLQCSGDKTLRKLVFSHLVQNICAMNRKHRNEAKNRALQNIIFPLTQEDDEVRSKQAFKLLCELYHRRVWVDERTANAICNSCFHRSTRIMIATLKFLHGYDNNYYPESDGSDDEKEAPDVEMAGVSKEAVYKAHHQGTASSRKKKQAKLERAMRSIKKQQRVKALEEGKASFAPLQQLQDPQAFAEKLFARLQKCNEKFQVKLMIIMVISRCVGMHQLLLLSFYPHLQRYVAPHQQEETQILAAAVQACHEKVPVDVVEPLLKQIVNTFVHDRSRPEVIAVGLNVVREICARMPLIMSEELLEDLAMYKKSREKAVSSAANSIIGLYRQIHPGLLRKKDRGRGADLSIKPRAFGESLVHTDVPGIEFLEQNEDDDESEERYNDEEDDSHDKVEDETRNEIEDEEDGNEDGSADEDEEEEEEGEENQEEVDEDDSANSKEEDGAEVDSIAESSDSDDDETECPEDDQEEEKASKRRKLNDGTSGQPMSLESMSLNQLKALAAAQKQDSSIKIEDGILSNEDFERIRKLQAKQIADKALVSHGVKVKSSDALSQRPINPSALEANIRKRQDKEERVATSRAGREESSYTARAAIKKKKTGGLSNRQKEKKKTLPVAAKRMKSSRNREQRKMKASRGGKQFRGRKAWK